jgi:plastocyanin
MLCAGLLGCSDSPAGPSSSARGGIAGAVRDGSAGVPGATLSLSGGTNKTTTSAASGSFSFADLTAGSYAVALTAPSGFTVPAGEANKSVTVVAGQTATVNFAVTAVGGGNVVTVNVSGFTFSPATVTVAAGTTVRWVNNTSNFHTVTPDGHTQWADADLPASGSFQHTFNTAGTFNYFCTPHRALGMTGTVNVQ